ncbi:MAG: hypothetical protein LBK67_11335 [Coriobacteriales bacterium]|nr:hypothetical protein [Coriobacteriales bacterium]
MPKIIKAILSALIFLAVTAVGYGVGKFFSIVFEGSTIRIGFIPLGNGTAGTIMLVVATLIGFGIACYAASGFYKNH